MGRESLLLMLMNADQEAEKAQKEMFCQIGRLKATGAKELVQRHSIFEVRPLPQSSSHSFINIHQDWPCLQYRLDPSHGRTNQRQIQMQLHRHLDPGRPHLTKRWPALRMPALPVYLNGLRVLARQYRRAQDYSQ